MQETQKKKIQITATDRKIVVSIAICYITAEGMSLLEFVFTYEGTELEIIQRMTSAIACLLVCQDNTALSRKAGINRMIITAIGGIAGVVVAVLDTVIQRPWVMAVMVILGILTTLVLCRAAGVPYINARIGGVTFVLVACTLEQYARVYYALFRFISTFYGAFVSVLITWIFGYFVSKRKGVDSQSEQG